MVHQLFTNDELDDQKKLFAKLDRNKDGMLQRDELIDGFREIYGEVVEQEVDEIMALADLNGNGELDYCEWLVATTKKADIYNSNKLKQAFQYFDRDNSGTITLEELKHGLGGICEGDNQYDEAMFADILAEVDINGDGEIDFTEF
jgi:calcium-dependent protein kinase